MINFNNSLDEVIGATEEIRTKQGEVFDLIASIQEKITKLDCNLNDNQVISMAASALHIKHEAQNLYIKYKNFQKIYEIGVRMN